MLKILSVMTVNFLSISLTWAAVENINSYKKTLSTLLPSSKTYFEKASNLKPEIHPLGSTISYNECEKILKRITLKPIELDCGDESNKRFFQKLTTKNQFGVQAKYLLQFFGEDEENKFQADVLLDSSYKLVEATSALFSKKNPDKAEEFSIFSRDEEGNVFENILSKNENGHTETRQGISLSNGTIPRGIQTNYSKNKKKSNDLTTVYLLKPLDSEKPTKNPFELPNNYESFVITYDKGKEKCMGAKVKGSDKIVHLPSEADWDKCSEAI